MQPTPVAPPTTSSNLPYVNRQTRRAIERNFTKRDRNAKRKQPSPRRRVPTAEEQKEIVANDLARSIRLKTKGAFGGPPKKAEKEAFLSRSNAEAKQIQQDRQHKRELARWFASLSEEDQAFARAHGLHDLPKDEQKFGATSEQEFTPQEQSDAESCGLHNGVPILRPKPPGLDAGENSCPEIEELSHEEIARGGAAFESALLWALGGADLVEMGRRALVMILAFRPNLVQGVTIDEGIGAEFYSRVRGDHRAAGILFGRALERIRSGSTLSACGQQLYVVAYVLRPAFIDTSTLAAIGSLNGKTRQALNRNVNALRDAYSGLKASTMRPEITRTRCQTSQLARA